MRAREISPLQFIVTITATERLILEAYADVFATTIQDAALVMCVRGFHSYAEMMIQYNRNAMIAFDDPKARKHLDTLKKLISNSDEAMTYRKAIQAIKDDLPTLET